jgi:hypothetical protein
MTPSRGPFVELRTNWHRTSAGRPHRTPVSSSRYSGQSRKITGPLISTSPPRCSRPARTSPSSSHKQGQKSRSPQAPPRACSPQGTTHGCRWPASHVEAVWRAIATARAVRRFQFGAAAGAAGRSRRGTEPPSRAKTAASAAIMIAGGRGIWPHAAGRRSHPPRRRRRPTAPAQSGHFRSCPTVPPGGMCHE